MKQAWLRLAARVDALAERERVLVFVCVLALLAFLGQSLVLGPIQRHQDLLRQQIERQRATLVETNEAVARVVAAAGVDPDRAQRERLLGLRRDNEQLEQGMRAMQSGLVAPERIGPLLESILRANGRLKLVSLRTLPVASLSEIEKADPEPADAMFGGATAAPSQTPMQMPNLLPAATSPAMASQPGQANGAPAAADQPDLLFRHGVEITVRGSYLDMVDYMTALEGLPTQLFWGRARLEVEQYPAAHLTLTLNTLSLDRKWMKL